jgi:cohesin domain-containing protein
VLVVHVEILERHRLSDEPTMSARKIKLATLVVVLALVTASACGGGSGASPSGSPPPLAASFVPDQPSPTANDMAFTEAAHSNDVVTVGVTLTDASGVYATAFEVVYDDTHTVYLGFTPGSVFEQGGNSPNYTVSATSGRIIVGVSRTGSTATNVSGTKTVLGLQFRVKQAGVYPLSIENAVVYDNQPTPQPIPGINWFAGAVTGV